MLLIIVFLQLIFASPVVALW